MSLHSCHICGLTQHLPAVVARGMRVRCARCHSSLRRDRSARSNQVTAALAAAALVLYPLAVTLPVMRVERFGHHHESGILEGTAALIGSGHLAIGLIVLLCSVVLPLAKLAALLVLCAGGWFMHHRHRAITWRMVELTGRWGMLDVLLVAVLVAALKLGDIVSVQPGPGAIAFAAVVLLSLLAGAAFDRRGLWG